MTDPANLGGRPLSTEEIKVIEGWIGPLPVVVVALLTEYCLIGINFTLSAENDESGLGAQLRWMEPDQMRSEATEAYPGVVALSVGYLPVGLCLEGSGDPYFIRLDDAALVRIPHDAALEGGLEEDAVETVLSSVVDFVRLAKPD